MIRNKRKKERIKINNLDEFKNALEREGYFINEFHDETFKERIKETFSIDSKVVERLYSSIKENDITYKVSNVNEFIEYIENIIVFENEHEKLWEKVSNIDKLHIDRIEYERIPSEQDDVDQIKRDIEKIKGKVAGVINNNEQARLHTLEKQLDNDYLYAKDIELLKKMLISGNKSKDEMYNVETKIKTITLDIPAEIGYGYIKSEEGSVEYYQHLTKTIPRIKRLIRNINKYMEVDEKEKTTFKIDQSKALQDSINIAVALYDEKEFKAISGSNEIKDYCAAPQKGHAVFKSSKVNKLGKLGIGYDRVNDSEKKILEEIHRQIEEKVLRDNGTLVLYTKWEPCPSCYSVISQFCKKYPQIRVEVKFGEKYGGYES